jgi:hypothetical protein
MLYLPKLINESNEEYEGRKAFYQNLKINDEFQHIKCPYNHGSYEYNEWMKGFKNGEANYNHNAGGDW